MTSGAFAFDLNQEDNLKDAIMTEVMNLRLQMTVKDRKISDLQRVNGELVLGLQAMFVRNTERDANIPKGPSGQLCFSMDEGPESVNDSETAG